MQVKLNACWAAERFIFDTTRTASVFKYYNPGKNYVDSKLLKNVKIPKECNWAAVTPSGPRFNVVTDKTFPKRKFHYMFNIDRGGGVIFFE